MRTGEVGLTRVSPCDYGSPTAQNSARVSQASGTIHALDLVTLFQSTLYPAACSSCPRLKRQLPLSSKSVQRTPRISEGTSSSPFLSAQTLHRPRLPMKYPSSRITFCRALLLPDETSSSAVSNITAKPTSEKLSNFSITVFPLLGCSCNMITSRPSCSKKRATLSLVPWSCP